MLCRVSVGDNMAMTRQILIQRVDKLEEILISPKRYFIQIADDPLPPEAVGDDVEIIYIRFFPGPPACIQQEFCRRGAEHGQV